MTLVVRMVVSATAVAVLIVTVLMRFVIVSVCIMFMRIMLVCVMGMSAFTGGMAISTAQPAEAAVARSEQSGVQQPVECYVCMVAGQDGCLRLQGAGVPHGCVPGVPD